MPHHQVLVGPLLSLPFHLVELLQLQLFGDFHLLLLLGAEVVPTVEDLALDRLVRIHLTALNIYLLIVDVGIGVLAREESGLGLHCGPVNFVFGGWALAFDKMRYSIIFETVSGR